MSTKIRLTTVTLRLMDCRLGSAVSLTGGAAVPTSGYAGGGILRPGPCAEGAGVDFLLGPEASIPGAGIVPSEGCRSGGTAMVESNAGVDGVMMVPGGATGPDG